MPRGITIIVVTGLLVVGLIVTVAVASGIDGMLVTGTITPIVTGCFSLATFYLTGKLKAKQIKDALEKMVNNDE